MAPTFRHSRTASFKITTTAGATMNLSSGLKECNLARQVDTADVTHFHPTIVDRSFVIGFRSGEFSVSGMWSTTHVVQLDALLGSTAGGLFTFGPESTTSGRRKYTGASILTSLEYGASIDDMVSMSANFKVNGAVTVNTY